MPGRTPRQRPAGRGDVSRTLTRLGTATFDTPNTLYRKVRVDLDLAEHKVKVFTQARQDILEFTNVEIVPGEKPERKADWTSQWDVFADGVKVGAVRHMRVCNCGGTRVVDKSEPGWLW